MEVKMEKQFKKHKHFQMGTGNKYKFIGIWSQPSTAILEANPTAYNNIMDSRPKCCHFSCDHCGMPIMNHHMIIDDKGAKFSVGSSCIEKLGDRILTTASKEAEKARQRGIRQAKAQAKRDAENKVREEEYERQRQVNGGLTDYELKNKQQQDRINSLRDQRVEIAEPLIKVLRQQNGDFCGSIVRSIVNRGEMPYAYAKNIVIEIMAKQFGRKNSKKYNEAYDAQVEIFEKVEKEMTALKS
jgi:hypothetical protein